MKKSILIILFIFVTCSSSLHAQPADDSQSELTLQKRVSDLEESNENLKTKLDDIEDRVDDIEQKLGES